MPTTIRSIVYLTVCALLLPTWAAAQQLTTLETSNYAGLSSVHLNPSSIADSRWGGMVQIGLGSMQFSPNPVGVETLLLRSERLVSGGQSLGVSAQDLRGPGVMMQFRPRHAAAFTTRYRSAVSLTSGGALTDWLGGNPAAFSATNLSFSTNTFTEYGVSYAASVLDIQKHYLKVGGTVKLLRGIQTGYLNVAGTFSAPASGNLAYALTSADYAVSDPAFTEKFSATDWLLGTSPGSGTGFDLGLTYEFRPQHELYRYPLNGRQVPDVAKTKYRLRLGLALIDVGSIRYGAVQTQRAGAKTGTLALRDLGGPTTTTAYLAALRPRLGLTDVPVTVAQTYTLPTTLVVQLDGRLSESWFAGAVLKSNDLATQLSVGPRYESPGADFAVSGHYDSRFSTVTLGTHLRVTIFTIGADNLLGFFSDNKAPVGFLAGMTIPIAPKRAKDRDGDNVSDSKDLCPNVKGLWTFWGCPDADEDGIRDQDDACPNEKGPKETNGCPDADGDGIFDKNDACPNEAGPQKFNGCPDKDGDNVPDKDDECPTAAGLPELGGCPDTDRDGLKDSADKCPSAPGLKELAGCPLRPLTRPDSTYSAQERTWLTQLTTDWLAGFRADSEGYKQAKAWGNLTPNGAVLLEFSGSDQAELLRVAAAFRDGLVAAQGTLSPFKVAVNRRQEPGVGLKITLQR